MDRAALQKVLALAVAHVRSGERQIAKQTQIVQDLRRGGHETATARAILETFLEIQDTFQGDLARLSNELDVVQASHRST